MRFYNVKKIIARILIVAMILSSNGFYAFAESIGSDIDASRESKVAAEKTDYTDPSDSVIPGDNTFGVAPTSTSSESSDEEGENLGEGNEYGEEPEEEEEKESTTIEESTTEEETTTSEETSSADETSSAEETSATDETSSTEETTTEEETSTEEATTTEEGTSTEEATTTEEEITTKSDNDNSNETATESDIAGEETTATESEILSDEKVATNSKIKVNDDIFGGVPGVSQTITLEFGEGYPLANSSTNWNVTSFAAQTAIPHTVSFTGSINTIISEFFVNSNYVTSANLPNITQNIGGESHIVLPTFDTNLWEGFIFDGWYDETNTQVTEIPYRFQDGDKTYTARWSKDTASSYNLNIKYIRTTAYSTDENEIAAEYTNSFSHDSNVDVDAKVIDGYSISNVEISTSSWASFVNLDIDSLKTQNFNKTSFIDYDANSLTLSADYNLDGAMPNHDIYIKVYYQPDNTVTKTVTINYKNENGTVIKEPRVLDYSVETIIDEHPANDIERYEFVDVEISCNAENINLGLLTLGSLHISDEKYTVDTVNANNGHFKALMPNQEVTITYIYRITKTRITLDFGTAFNPRATASSNWNVTSWGASTTSPQQISFLATPNYIISDLFVESGYVSEASLSTISVDSSGERCIVLPKFPDNLWTGFEFIGWYDNTDTLVPYQSGNQKMPYRVGNEDVTYTAKWRETTDNFNITARYLRSTYSTAWNPADTSGLIDGSLASTVVNSVQVNTEYYRDAVQIPGYKISGYRIVDSSGAELQLNSLKMLDYTGTTYVDIGTTPLTIDGEYAITGSFPNHEVFIDFYYEPDENNKVTFTVKYVSLDYNSLRDNVVINCTPETIVEANPFAGGIDRYTFLRAEVVCPDAYLPAGVLTLGSMHVSGETYTNDDVNAAGNNAHFKAVMPNQNVTINYIYKLNVQKITLNFGEGRPGINSSSNWRSGWIGAVQDTIEFIQPSGTNMHTYFSSGAEGRYDGSTVNNISQPHGAGEHIIMPTFSETTWNEFEFRGWFDNEDVAAKSYNNNQELNYVFQYVDDETYTAKWERVPGAAHTLYIRYIRATNSSIWTGPYDPAAPITKYDLANASSYSYSHGTRIAYEPKSIYGYKITDCHISRTSMGDSDYDEGLDALKPLAFDGTSYVTFDSNDLAMSNYSLSGVFPNHDIYIDYYYEPDPNAKSNVSIMYYNQAGTSQVRASEEFSYKVEDIISFDPKPVTQYTYVRAQVSDSTHDFTNHIFALGEMHTSDEKYTTEALNAAGNNGHFKAVMPNQSININYFYRLEGTQTTVYVREEVMNENDDYDVSTRSYVVNIGSPAQVIYIDHKEDEGYGVPDVNFSNIAMNQADGEEYVYNSGETDASGNQLGKVTYHIDTDEVPIIKVRYAYDRTSNYWTKLGFNAKDVAGGGHGTISKADGAKELTERYVKRGENYTLAQLTDGVVTNPNENYMCVWYKSNMAGNDKDGDPLTTTGTINVSSATFNLFADFPEDPTKWVDITFTAAENSTLSGSTTFHIPKDSPRTSITFPTVNVAAGYHQVVDAVTGNGIWLDANTGNPLGNTFTATATYKPSIESNFPGSPTPVKPVLHVTYNSNGTGKANLFGTYGDRQYVLTDRNGKVLKVCTAAASTNGFDNLTPGTTYRMYEALSSATITVGQNIPTTDVSDPYVFGIKALNSAPTVTANNDDTYSIAFTQNAGVSYALLDDRYNVASDWVTNQTFTGLRKGTYYLVVAKASSDNIAANDELAIRNGYVVYTSKNDLTDRKYRLVFFGTGNVSGAGTAVALPVPLTGSVYEVEAGKNVRITGNSGYTTFIMTCNTSIGSAAGTVSPYVSKSNATNIQFTMPEQDVVVNRIQFSDTVAAGANAPKNTIVVNSNDANMSLTDLSDIRAELNTDTTIADAMAQNCEVHHYIEINKYASRKTRVEGLGEHIISPYEYTLDVQSIVQGKPYRSSEIGDCIFEGYLALDKEILGNVEFTNEDAMTDVACPYAPGDDTKVGTVIFNMGVDEYNGINYKRRHNINAASNITTGGLQYELDMVVYDSTLLNTAANFNELQARFTNLWDNAATNANKKEYIYNGLYEGDAVFNYATQNINRAKNLTLKYTLNQDREDKKNELSAEIVSAASKASNLTNAEVIATLNAAITVARNIRSEQNAHTVAELASATTTLRNAKNAAEDPQMEGESIVVSIDANGGTANTNAITVFSGNAYKFDALSVVEATRSEYDFVSWNTMADGSGLTITSETVVGFNPPTTLYAIWEEAEAPEPEPTPPRPRPSGGGGGGGGGGGRVREQVITDKQYAVMPQVSTDQLVVSGYTVQVPVNLNAIYMEENTDTGFYSIFDPATNVLSVKLGDKVNKVPARDRWVELQLPNGDKRIYRTDASGNVVSGKFLDQNGQMYYLSNTSDLNYGMLAFGWVKDPANGYWYYSNPQTGSLTTGWQAVDGKYYYFYKPLDDKGNMLTTDLTAFISQYGMMMSDVQLPTNETLDSTGAMVTATPYMPQ